MYVFINKFYVYKFKIIMIWVCECLVGCNCGFNFKNRKFLYKGENILF